MLTRRGLLGVGGTIAAGAVRADTSVIEVRMCSDAASWARQEPGGMSFD